MTSPVAFFGASLGPEPSVSSHPAGTFLGFS
jgi:hypothetical protein